MRERERSEEVEGCAPLAWSTSPVLSGCALAGLSGGARGDLRATWLSFIAINNINVIFDRESVDIRRFRVRIPGRILCPVGPTVRRLTTELFLPPSASCQLCSAEEGIVGDHFRGVWATVRRLTTDSFATFCFVTAARPQKAKGTTFYLEGPGEVNGWWCAIRCGVKHALSKRTRSLSLPDTWYQV